MSQIRCPHWLQTTPLSSTLKNAPACYLQSSLSDLKSHANSLFPECFSMLFEPVTWSSDKNPRHWQQILLHCYGTPSKLCPKYLSAQFVIWDKIPKICTLFEGVPNTIEDHRIHGDSHAVLGEDLLWRNSNL